MTLSRAIPGLLLAAASLLVCAGRVEAQSPPRLVLVDDAAELEGVLAGKTAARDLVLHLAAVSVPDADPAKVRLLLIAEIAAGASSRGGEASAAAVSEVGRLASVMYVLEDERGQARGRALRRVSLVPSSTGLQLFSEVVIVSPGRYRLRAAAYRDGKMGLGEAAVTAALQSAAALRFGDLAMGEAAGEDLASSVSAERKIGTDRMTASLPLAAQGGLLPEGLSIAVEVAKAAASPALATAPAAVQPVEIGQPVSSGLGDKATQPPVQPAAPDRVAQAVVDTRALPPGAYVARALVSIGGQEVARIVAPFTREAAAAAPAAASATRGRGTAAGPAASAATFRLEDVLDASVLGPFLDELATRAGDRAKPAIEQARLGRFPEAAQAAGAAGQIGPAKPFLQGLALFSKRQYQAASDAFRDTLREAPDFFVGAFYIGACYGAGGRDPQAINAWQTSLVGLEQYPVVYRVMAAAMTRLGQHDRALETLDEALGKWPADGEIRVRAARAALEARRYDRVFALVDAGIEGRPPSDLLLAGIQAAYEQATQPGGAAGGDAVARARKYRDAYAASSGPQQALVAEWMAAIERKK
jgi:tetratricopeptide (TPR) repeat protein